MKYFIAVLAIYFGLTVNGQPNNTCLTAQNYIDNSFVGPFIPPTNWVELYYTFTAPDDSIDFSFTAFSAVLNGVALCPTIDVIYFLFDSNCGFLATSATGEFTNLTPGQQYVLGYLANCPAAGIGFILTSEDIVLPVRLLYFTAKSSVSSIDLIWSTATETNCAGFLIDRSVDVSTWTNMGFVEGAGNSQQVTRYLFSDNKPIEGVNYYRLTQYDLDGDFEILQIIAIMFNKEVKTNLFRQYNFLGQKIR